MKQQQHRRTGAVDIGCMSFDLCTLGHGEGFVLVAVYRGSPRVVTTRAIAHKTTAMIQQAVHGTIVELEYLYGIEPISRVHCDRERAVDSDDFKFDMNSRGISVTLTQGHDSKANGQAERHVGILKELARKRLIHISDRDTRRYLWPYAM